MIYRIIVEGPVPLTTTIAPTSSSVSPMMIPAPAVIQRNVNQKRHSLCAVSPSGLTPLYQRSVSHTEGQSQHQTQQQYRHSMEILSNCDDDDDNNENISATDARENSELKRAAGFRNSFRNTASSNQLAVNSSLTESSINSFHQPVPS